MRKILAGLDVGSNTLKLVVGEMVKNKLNILSVSETPSSGVKSGIIINQTSLIESLKILFKSCEDSLGIAISKVLVTVPQNYVDFTIGEGTTNITNSESLVGGNDIIRALQASSFRKIPDNMEIITTIPTSFKIDDEEIVKEPKNKVAKKLTAKSVIVSTPKKYAYPIIGCLETIGVEVVDICLGSMGDYYSFKSEETDDAIGVIINIGEATTTVSIFNRGVLTNTEVIDLGGVNIDNDICFIYKVTKSDARSLKEKLALAHKRLAQVNETLTITNKLGENLKVNQYEVSEIAMSRLTEILNMSKKQINLLTKKEISYIIFTGGVSEMRDFPLVLEEVFGRNVSLGVIRELGVRNNKYSSCIGTIKCFNERLVLRDKEFSVFNLDELEEFSGNRKKINIKEGSILGNLFGYFFDN